MKTINQVDLVKFFVAVETEYLANQQMITELETKQAKLRALLSKRNKPYPRPPLKPIKGLVQVKLTQ